MVANVQENLKRLPTSVPSTPQKAKKSRVLSPSQTQLPAFFPISSDSAMGTIPNVEDEMNSPKLKPNGVSSTHSLHLSDTKTRTSASLPTLDNSQNSRLQLMIYRRLLNVLICQSPLFDFASIWARLNLNPRGQFSWRFIEQARSVLLTTSLDCNVFGPPEMNCLEDMCGIWNSYQEQLHVDGVHSTLKLVYRSQPKRKPSRKGKERQKAASPLPSPPSELEPFLEAQEDHDMAKAIEASLQDLISPGTSSESHGRSRDIPKASGSSSTNIVEVLEEVPQLRPEAPCAPGNDNPALGTSPLYLQDGEAVTTATGDEDVALNIEGALKSVISGYVC